jgi:hypothetical protein
MCCFFATLVALGPRAAILVWWLVDTARWELAFSNFFWAFLGFIFLPWTTLAWVAVWSPSGLTGFDWVILALGVFIDIASYGASEYGRRDRYATV